MENIVILWENMKLIVALVAFDFWFFYKRLFKLYYDRIVTIILIYLI